MPRSNIFKKASQNKAYKAAKRNELKYKRKAAAAYKKAIRHLKKHHKTSVHRRKRR